MVTHPCAGKFPQVRPRRMRKDEFTRLLMRENTLSAADLIQPIFIHDESGKDQAIPSMPGIMRMGIKSLVAHCKHYHALGITAVALFPSLPSTAKSADAKQAWDPNGLVPRAVAAIKCAVPQLGVITDVALDPYTSNGQDGLCDAHGYVENDRTVAALVKQALVHLQAGADIVAPSDMMDGRVRALRDAFEQNGYPNARILAYCAKYASNFYVPFRDAVDSGAALAGGDKTSYQMDPANGDEALREAALDVVEGADMLMVKPGSLSLDIVWRLKQAFGMPTFAYQVSGEYAMLKAAAQNNWLDERSTVLETLTCFKRAGCDGIMTYYGAQVAEWLQN